MGGYSGYFNERNTSTAGILQRENCWIIPHGQVASLFKETGVQQEFAFIPDDGSATYVINVETNTTQSLPGPSTKDAKAIYAAGITSLVQLDSTGALNFLPYTAGQASANAKAAWTKVANVLAVAPPGATSSGSSSASAN